MRISTSHSVDDNQYFVWFDETGVRLFTEDEFTAMMAWCKENCTHAYHVSSLARYVLLRNEIDYTLFTVRFA